MTTTLSAALTIVLCMLLELVIAVQHRLQSHRLVNVGTAGSAMSSSHMHRSPGHRVISGSVLVIGALICGHHGTIIASAQALITSTSSTKVLVLCTFSFSSFGLF